jgi:hypothetical protein
MKLCDMCGRTLQGGYGIGGAMVCRECEPELTAEIEATRSSGKPVNAMHIARRIYKETHSGGNYMLRDVPEDLMARAKHRAVDDKCSVRDVILRAMAGYLS